MLIARNVRIKSGDIVDLAIVTADIADDAVTAAKVADHTLGSYHLQAGSAIIYVGTQIKNAIITEPKFSAHLEYGTITGITATGRYRAFTTAFGAAPAVVVGAVDKAARLANASVAGSFKVELDLAGTANGYFIAWGQRA